MPELVGDFKERRGDGVDRAEEDEASEEDGEAVWALGSVGVWR
jgi:hypothetical protein